MSDEMNIQNIRALLLFISFIFFVFFTQEANGNNEWSNHLLGVSFFCLLVERIVCLIASWHGERRKVDRVGEDKLPWMLKRQTD